MSNKYERINWHDRTKSTTNCKLDSIPRDDKVLKSFLLGEWLTWDVWSSDFNDEKPVNSNKQRRWL